MPGLVTFSDKMSHRWYFFLLINSPSVIEKVTHVTHIHHPVIPSVSFNEETDAYNDLFETAEYLFLGVFMNTLMFYLRTGRAASEGDHLLPNTAQRTAICSTQPVYYLKYTFILLRTVVKQQAYSWRFHPFALWNVYAFSPRPQGY